MRASHLFPRPPAACLLMAATAALLPTLDWTCVQWETANFDTGGHSKPNIHEWC